MFIPFNYMCGITAILSKKNENISDLILDSLNLIQNRGL